MLILLLLLFGLTFVFILGLATEFEDFFLGLYCVLPDRELFVAGFLTSLPDFLGFRILGVDFLPDFELGLTFVSPDFRGDVRGLTAGLVLFPFVVPGRTSPLRGDLFTGFLTVVFLEERTSGVLRFFPSRETGFFRSAEDLLPLTSWPSSTTFDRLTLFASLDLLAAACLTVSFRFRLSAIPGVPRLKPLLFCGSPAQTPPL